MAPSLRFSGRFSLLFAFIKSFLVASSALRVVLFLWQPGEVSWNAIDVARTFLTGVLYDSGTAVFIALPAVLYFTILPGKLTGSWLDRIVTTSFFLLTVLVLVFTFFAEITFWDEFRTRFNFIAVDYLIYTHEVVANIQQSYPLPLLIAGVVLVTLLVYLLFRRNHIFDKTYAGKPLPKERAALFFATILIGLFYGAFITNDSAEWSANRYNSELSKSGIYSFFAAFRNNRMDYTDFFTSVGNENAFQIAKNKLAEPNTVYSSGGFSVHRTITDSLPSAQNKNVVFILVESLSASFMAEFGNKDHITPFLDSLSQKSVFFTNLYATGTRTVRGMEAVTLCIPPTPGQSIVKRPQNQNLYTISNVFAARKYDCNFFYGGDGYFDNMNAFFGGNGFNIYDRGHGSVLSDKIKTKRNNIDNKEVTFENAWGICDEDIFNKMLKVADEKYASGQPFLNFVMTTSNHRPYTYPEGKIDIPSGKSRNGAVKYTDFALKELFRKASARPWYQNTVFVIIADHCASSAGKDEIDVANYHIPAFIVNLPESENRKITKQCSQIDLFPTLFSLFHWNYESDFFGKDVNRKDFEPRALVGTYQKLALMKQDKAMILSTQKKQAFYQWDQRDNSLRPLPMDSSFLNETISWYQTADYLFSKGLLK